MLGSRCSKPVVDRVVGTDNSLKNRGHTRVVSHYAEENTGDAGICAYGLYAAFRSVVEVNVGIEGDWERDETSGAESLVCLY
jgi:hypothetical protein